MFWCVYIWSGYNVIVFFFYDEVRDWKIVIFVLEFFLINFKWKKNLIRCEYGLIKIIIDKNNIW